MCNAREEFLKHTSNKTVIAAKILLYYEWSDVKKHFILKLSYTESDFDVFLSNLNFDYDAYFNSSALNGVIWYDNKTWSERCNREWVYKSCPDIPEICKA